MDRDEVKEKMAYEAMRKVFENPDPRSYGVYRMIQEIYPALAKKMFENSELMRKLVMTQYNPMDILDYPVCGKCESIAAWNGLARKNGKLVRKCTCVADGCHASTADPPTFRTWLVYEMKKKAPADFAEVAEYIVDGMALRLVKKAKDDYVELLKDIREPRNQAMGLVNANGKPIRSDVQPKKKVPLIKTTESDIMKSGIKIDFDEV